MGFKLSEDSLAMLRGANIELAKVILKATEYTDEKFEVIDLKLKNDLDEYGYQKAVLRRVPKDLDYVEDALHKASSYWDTPVKVTMPIDNHAVLNVTINNPRVQSTYFGELQ